MGNYLVYGYSMGNPIHWDDNNRVWILTETGENLCDVDKDLICPRCNKKADENGHDPCISNLPNVKYACCGHGISKEGCEQAYIKFNSGEVVRFGDTDSLLEYAKNLK